MFETFFLDSGFIQITFIFIVLVIIAIWQKLKQFAAVMCIIYIVYLVFSIFDLNKDDLSKIRNDKIEKTDTTIVDITPEINLVDEIETNDSNEVIQMQKPLLIKDKKEKIKLSDKKSSNLSKQSTINAINIDNNVLIIPDNVIKDQLAETNPIEIKYFKLGRNLQNKELISIDSIFYTDDERIYCMTKIQNQNNGKVIFHNWYKDNKLISKIRMEIGWSYNWRTWSYINVNTRRTGDWKVVISDTLDTRYDSLSFTIRNTLQ